MKFEATTNHRGMSKAQADFLCRIRHSSMEDEDFIAEADNLFFPCVRELTAADLKNCEYPLLVWYYSEDTEIPVPRDICAVTDEYVIFSDNETRDVELLGKAWFIWNGRPELHSILRAKGILVK